MFSGKQAGRDFAYAVLVEQDTMSIPSIPTGLAVLQYAPSISGDCEVTLIECFADKNDMERTLLELSIACCLVVSPIFSYRGVI